MCDKWVMVSRDCLITLRHITTLGALLQNLSLTVVKDFLNLQIDRVGHHTDSLEKKIMLDC